MAAHEKFRLTTLDDLSAAASRLGLEIPAREDVSVLLEPAIVAGRRLPNRLAVLPMEGADAEDDGQPSEWTLRRYRRFAAGGAAVIWLEATAVSPEGRSNPHQLLISARTLTGFGRLAQALRTEARRTWGPSHEPFLVLQLTHSGRFSKPGGTPSPRIVQRNPYLDPLHGLSPEHPILSDAELEEVRDRLVDAAELAVAAGFDAVDVKACHGYLVSETLAAHARPASRFGGPFENRTKLLLDTVRLVREEAPTLVVTSRLSATDTVPFPYGFGMDPDEPERLDPTEAKSLASRLAAMGAPILSYSLGIPFWKPHFGRPFDTPIPGGRVPDEHPLEGVARHLRLASELQKSAPGTALVGAGYSWLRHLAPHVAAAMVASGRTAIVGLGRGALAYPDFPKDLADRGRLDPGKACTTCSLCSHLLRQGRRTGCVVRDAEVYKV